MKVLDDQAITEIDNSIQLLVKGKAAEAAIEMTTLLQKDPTNSLLWSNRGLALMQLGHPFDGALNIEKAIAIKPDEAEYYINLGACYAEMEVVPKALACYKKSIDLNPKIAASYMNIANALKFAGRIQESLEYYRKCVEVDPNFVNGHLFRAFTELKAGNYKEGWEEFEWRWKSDQLVPRGLPIKQWNGEPLEGKRLLIYGEQGHGDSLQFVRYANMVKEKYGGHISFEVRQPCARLFQSVKGIDRVITYGEKVAATEFDYTIPVMSLPRIFGTTVETIPWSGPYFTADEYRVGLWRERLKQLPPGMLIGICWAGLSRPGQPQADAIDKKRSMALADFAPMAQIPGLAWVSLQKGMPRDQVMIPPVGMSIGDWSDDFYDFYDTAALIECLDLVITVDTAVVHLAAGLGKPTWLLSRWDGCWRWFDNDPTNPWYPTVRVFGQHGPNDWKPVIKDMTKALHEYVQARKLKAA